MYWEHNKINITTCVIFAINTTTCNTIILPLPLSLPPNTALMPNKVGPMSTADNNDMTSSELDTALQLNPRSLTQPQTDNNNATTVNGFSNPAAYDAEEEVRRKNGEKRGGD